MYQQSSARLPPLPTRTNPTPFQVAPGELTLVTGVPNSGKSEWLDALAVNLAARHGWRFALCSLENDRLGHLVKLLEKRVGRPFRDGAGGRVRMTWQEAVSGWQWGENKRECVCVCLWGRAAVGWGSALH